MQRAALGYTIIEVMIFIAISGLLLFSAIVAVGGQTAHTEFSTSVRDTNSKMQQWIAQVNNGFSDSSLNGVRNFSCSVNLVTGYPQFLPLAGNRGQNSDCTFIGRSIQVVTDKPATQAYSNALTAYTVIGRRTMPAGVDVVQVDSLTNARPVAAINALAPTVDLSETYNIPNSTRVKSVTSSNPTCVGAGFTNNACYMAGFFLNFNTENNTSGIGASSVNSYLYNFPDSDGSNFLPKSQQLLDCISLKATGGVDCSNTESKKMVNWTICLESTRNSDTASITINSSSGKGATTSLSFNPC